MDKIMVINKIEDIIDKGDIVGKLVTDKAGNQVKVKKGQGGALATRWDELQLGKAYKFKMGEFKGFPFVENFELVKNIFTLQAQKEVENTREQSIESQVAAKIAGELLVSGIITKEDKLGQLLIQWCIARLGNIPQPPPDEPGGQTAPLKAEINGNIPLWNDVAPKISQLVDNKKVTIANINKRLLTLGAQDTGVLKTEFESLSPEKKGEFAFLVDEACQKAGLA